jgi:hypothetical protein
MPTNFVPDARTKLDFKRNFDITSLKEIANSFNIVNSNNFVTINIVENNNNYSYETMMQKIDGFTKFMLNTALNEIIEIAENYKKQSKPVPTWYQYTRIEEVNMITQTLKIISNLFSQMYNKIKHQIINQLKNKSSQKMLDNNQQPNNSLQQSNSSLQQPNNSLQQIYNNPLTQNVQNVTDGLAKFNKF